MRRLVLKSTHLIIKKSLMSAPKPSDVSQSSWRSAYDALMAEDDDSADFQVLNQHNADTRSLLIWVHPGDAIEDEESFETCDTTTDDEDEENLYQNSCDFQVHMAREILARKNTHQVIVLHRISSQWAFDEGHAEFDYQNAMQQIEDLATTVHLFGDDLDKAAAWIIEHMHTPLRPAVFLTGAYNDVEHGCVAAIGQAIGQAGCVDLKVSSWSPSEPGSMAGGWRPTVYPEPASPLAARRQRPR